MDDIGHGGQKLDRSMEPEPFSGGHSKLENGGKDIRNGRNWKWNPDPCRTGSQEDL